jgi:predicted DNA-binding transcriptional regulator AlpA
MGPRDCMAPQTASAAGERLLTAQQVGELLQLSTSTVLDWFEGGKFDGCAFRLGGKKGGPVRFRLSEIEVLLETWRVSAPIGADGREPVVPSRAGSSGAREVSLASLRQNGSR